MNAVVVAAMPRWKLEAGSLCSMQVGVMGQRRALLYSNRTVMDAGLPKVPRWRLTRLTGSLCASLATTTFLDLAPTRASATVHQVRFHHCHDDSLFIITITTTTTTTSLRHATTIIWHCSIATGTISTATYASPDQEHGRPTKGNLPTGTHTYPHVQYPHHPSPPWRPRGVPTSPPPLAR